MAVVLAFASRKTYLIIFWPSTPAPPRPAQVLDAYHEGTAPPSLWHSGMHLGGACWFGVLMPWQVL